MAFGAKSCQFVFRSCLHLVLCALVLTWQGRFGCAQQIPAPTIYALRPRGVRVTVPDESGLSSVSFHANVNRAVPRLTAGEVNVDLSLNGRQWLYEDYQTVLNGGDYVYYWMYSIINGEGYISEGKSYIPVTTGTTQQSSDVTASPERTNTALIPVLIETPIPSTDVIVKPSASQPISGTVLQPSYSAGSQPILAVRPVAIITNSVPAYVDLPTLSQATYDQQNQYGANQPVVLTRPPETLLPIQSAVSNNDLNSRPLGSNSKPVVNPSTAISVQQPSTSGFFSTVVNVPVQSTSSGYTLGLGGRPVQQTSSSGYTPDLGQSSSGYTSNVGGIPGQQSSSSTDYTSGLGNRPGGQQSSSSFGYTSNLGGRPGQQTSSSTDYTSGLGGRPGGQQTSSSFGYTSDIGGRPGQQTSSSTDYTSGQGGRPGGQQSSSSTDYTSGLGGRPSGQQSSSSFGYTSDLGGRPGQQFSSSTDYTYGLGGTSGGQQSSSSFGYTSNPGGRPGQQSSSSTDYTSGLGDRPAGGQQTSSTFGYTSDLGGRPGQQTSSSTDYTSGLGGTSSGQQTSSSFGYTSNLGGRPSQTYSTVTFPVSPSGGIPSQQYPTSNQLSPSDLGGKFPACELSQTIVNGRFACRGEVVFLDTFTIYNSSLWTVDTEFPSLPDSEFCIFSNHRGNSRIPGDSLQISPTLTEDRYGKDFVFKGRLDLTDCTAPTRDRCSQQGEYAYILPPVISARYSTRGKFSFRYGKVDIVAKLPQGDWLYPELRLESASRHPVRWDSSLATGNRIEVAVVRGNSRLYNDTGEDVGSSLLEAGACRPGWTKGELAKKTFVYREPQRRRWTDSFHTFSVLWMKDAIAFSVDGVEVGVLDSRDSEMPSSIFDKEMELVVGLGVGGVRVFPDTSGKPWSNTEPKAMYKFWNAKDYWYPTWRRESSVLIVKSVKVTAL